MPRPRTISDAALISAATSAIMKRGDASWSLADAAAEAGVTPGALMKRFGSKRGLLLAVAQTWAEGTAAYDPSAVDDPVAHLEQWVEAWLAETADPRFALGSLTLLLDEIADDEIRALLQQGRTAQAAYIDAALSDAVRRGALHTAPPTETSAVWLDLLAGCVISGAITGTRDSAVAAARFITHHIDQWRTT